VSALVWQLGRVTGCEIKKDRGVFLTLWLEFDFGGSGQCLGGHIFWNEANDSDSSPAGLDYIAKVMAVCQADELSECVGSYIEVGRKNTFDTIAAIRRPACDGESSFYVSEWRARWFGDES